MDSLAKRCLSSWIACGFIGIILFSGNGLADWKLRSAVKKYNGQNYQRRYKCVDANAVKTCTEQRRNVDDVNDTGVRTCKRANGTTKFTCTAWENKRLFDWH